MAAARRDLYRLSFAPDPGILKTLLGLAVVAWLRGQTPTLPPAPSQLQGQQIIQKAVVALGGGEFTNMRSVTTKGRIYGFFHDQLSGYDIARTYVEYADAPPPNGLAVKERQVLGKKQDYSVLYLPDQAFDLTFRGARPLPDESWQRYDRATRNDIRYILRYRLKEPGMQFDYVGSDVMLSTHVEVVDVSDSVGLTIRVYFDHNSMLPIRQVYKWMNPVTRERNEEVTFYDKWRDAGSGVMWPFSIERQRNGYKIFQSFSDAVAVNSGLPDKIFDLPPGAKILKKVD
jgi:hypothetical protein